MEDAEERPTLSEFLREKVNFRAILEPDLLQFLTKHMHEFLCLLNEDSDDSKLAFVMLSNLPSLIAKQIENDDSIYIALTEMLGAHAATPLCVSRIATVLENLAARCPNDAARMIGYFPVLLNYIEESSVLGFFERITSDAPKFAAFHECIARVGLDAMVNDKLAGDSESQATVNLLRLITFCCRPRVTRAGFANPRTISTLARYCAADDSSVQDRCWEAVRGLCCPETAQLFVILCARAIDVAKETREVTRGVCAVWDFLGKMVLLDDFFAEHVMETGLCEVAVRQMIMHGECANLMGPVFRFVEAGMKCCLMPHMIQHVMPFVVESGRKKKVDAVSANSRRLLAEIFAREVHTGPMREWIEREIGLGKLKAELIDPYVFALKEPYGGFHHDGRFQSSLQLFEGSLISVIMNRLSKKKPSLSDT